MVSRLYGTPRECPLGTCSRTVRAGQLLCGPHWHQLPKPLQSDVWRTWRAWTRDHTDDAWAAYAVARQAALDHFSGNQ